ncbi:MAG TPA: ATP-binding cassette domain-containing protein [Parafilimonas sp.]|nr:ATP-binding cassette domain-containing protein [Parafilimonas sp.]
MQISLTNAGKRFSREWIFRNLTWQFLSGNSYAITGPNGSGKSTLLQILSGALALNEGNSEWKSDGLTILADKVYLHIAIAAPYFELIEEMTAKEFLTFHSSFKTYINDVSIASIIQEAGLLNAADKQIRFFSSGMKQRLKLAQAIFSDVPAILLDEPCTNLDAPGFELYYRWIDNYCKNRLVIISSNDKNEYHFCDHQINLQDYKLSKPPVYP